MKKIITILFCTAIFTSGFAQTKQYDPNDRNRNENSSWNRDKQKGYEKDHDRDGRYDQNDRRYQDNNNSRNSQRDMQIQRITHQYDYRIQQVSYDRSLNRRKKERAIAQLQAEKAQALNNVYAQYRNNSTYNNRDYDDNRNNDNNRNNGYRK